MGNERHGQLQPCSQVDREIQRLRTLFASGTDPDATVAFVSTARKSRDIVPGLITPSAQDRIDMRFKAQSTPYPIV